MRKIQLPSTQQYDISQAAIGGELPLYGTMRICCPYCLARDERSMAITRESLGLLYRCHRSTCDRAGFIPLGGQILQGLPDKDNAKPAECRLYKKPLFPISAASEKFFAEKYELAIGPTRSWIQETESGEYALPIYDTCGYERGHVIRQPWKGAPIKPSYLDRPKALIYGDLSKPMQSFYGLPQYGRVVICEDQLSAMKVAVSGLACGVAILGTHLDACRVREIAMLAPKEVILAFDEDATSKAFRAAKQWGMAFRNGARVAMLQKDLKDTHMADFTEVLGIHE